ncbi:MAG: RNA-dependent DNA polymerase [Clostridia bacterium]|nr:RNA-dependent DNA polymerase [Clostridia bacterium]
MPKTIRNEYDKKLTYENLMKAHLLSRKGKGYREEVIKFNLKQEEYILWLYRELKNGTYKHGGYTTFYITEPKLRKIEKSRYIDRIVHRFVVDNFLIPYFVPTFIPTSYACLKSKGMHKACLDLQRAMMRCRRTWKEYYILKLDIKKYFQNIHKEILSEILKRKIKDRKLLKLIEEILYSNKGKRNLPIGNYTSQMFANIYLNELDQYMKHELHCKYVFRYMDDIVVLIENKKESKVYLEKITRFLKEKLDLELNEKTQIFKSKQGVNFCGYKINEYRLKIRDKGKRKLKKKIKEMKYNIEIRKINSKEAKKYLCGHMGYIKIANANHLSQKLFYMQ